MRWASQQFALCSKGLHLLFHLGLDLGETFFHFFRADDIVAGGENGHMAHNIFALAGQGIKTREMAVDFIARNSTRMAYSSL